MLNKWKVTKVLFLFIPFWGPCSRKLAKNLPCAQLPKNLLENFHKLEISYKYTTCHRRKANSDKNESTLW